VTTEELLGGVVGQLEGLLRGGDLNDVEAKEVDLAARHLRLVVYSRKRAATSDHQSWLAAVKRQRDIGELEWDALTAEELEAMAKGR
jgi:hypothetical protein